jgi:4a-hydroxytetrahydrobiopterin dehydratase
LGKDIPYNAAEIETKLADLPHWIYVDGALQRTFRTANFKAILMATMAVGHLCEAAWHHPELILAYNTLTVRLSTHSAKGITGKDFALARKIEDVVGWQPGRDGGALTGTPSDPAFAYIKYD